MSRLSREVSPSNSYLANTSFRDLVLQSKRPFQGLKEVSFLSYYPPFNLVLCSTCNQGVTSFETHLGNRHFLETSRKDKREIISKVLSIISGLKISTLEESIELIYKFINQRPLYPFPELRLVPCLYKCAISSCMQFKVSKPSMVRHIRLSHKDLLEDGVDISQYHVQVKGQSLESTRLFFPITIEERQGSPDRLELGEIFQEESNITQAKEAFKQASQRRLISFNQKQDNSRLIIDKDISPFQTKTRYLDFINQFPTKDLVGLCEPINKDNALLKILDINLKEILYLSLEKSIYLNKIHLNLLNSFEEGKTRNQGFKIVLQAKSRVDYFNFYSDYLAFVVKSLKYKKRLFKVSPEFKTLSRELEDLLSTKLVENISTMQDSGSDLKRIMKSLHVRLVKRKTRELILENNKEEDDEDSEYDNSRVESEDGVGNNSLDSSSDSGSTSSNSDHSDTSNILTSSTSQVIGKLKEINYSKDKLSLQIKDKIIELLILAFKYKTDLNIFDSSINCFFACKSIRPNNYSIRDTTDLSQYYSRFIYCTQLVVLEYLFRDLILNPANSLADNISTFMSNYFVNSSQTALGEILLNRSYCFKVNRELSSSSRVIIHPQLLQTLSYKKVTISVFDIKVLFKNLISTSYNLLIESLLFAIPSEEYKEITLEEFSKVEDRDNTDYNKCFSHFHPSYELHSAFLSERILNNPHLRSQFFNFSNNTFDLRSIRVRNYYKDILEFKRLSLLLIYLLSGLPLRGTELVSLRYKNSQTNPRELFLDMSSNLFILNISKYKSGHISEKKASNIRYLPRSVSYIFLLYIVLVDPFVQYLNINLASKNTSNILSPYYFYFNKRYLESRDLSLKLASFSTISIGQRIGIQTYRQLIVGMMREFMSEDLDQETLTLCDSPLTSNISNIRANQMNHSLGVEELHYGRTSNTFVNIRGDLQSKYLEFCLRFFDFFEISSPNPSKYLLVNNLMYKYKAIKSNSLLKADSPALKYSRNTLYSRKHTRQVSSIDTGVIRAQSIKKLKLSDLRVISSKTTTSSILGQLLREFLNDSTAAYKIIEQELLVKCILLKIPYILGVLPTNSGKSLTYLLTASLTTSKVSLIIAPLVGLKKDILRRAKEFNIPCSIFEDNLEFKTITLISIESIVNPTFISALNTLIKEDKLDRIIFDECHLLVTASSYRGIMYRFIDMLIKTVQFVFLTGTLPLSLEARLLSQLSIQDIAIIRANCSRNNISYQAQKYNDYRPNKRVQQVKAYIENFDFLDSNNKVIIFCPTLDEIDFWASTLGCSSYSSRLSDSEKEEALNNFINKTDAFNAILVASSGLEEGFDCSNIRLVIYLHYCHTFIGFLQGSSRGGRDSKPATSMFFYSSGAELAHPLETIEEGLFRTYLREKCCRRIIINNYIDNDITEKCLPNQELCDLCLDRKNIQDRQVSRIIELSKEVELKRAQFIDHCRVLASNCVYCTFNLTYEIGSTHLSEECSRYPELEELALEIREMFQAKQFVLSQDSCCFTCLLPTVFCTQLREGLERDCYLKYFMIRVIALLYIKQDLSSKSHNIPPYRDLFSKRSFEHIELFTKGFVKKSYIDAYRTEAILGFRFLVIDS